MKLVRENIEFKRGIDPAKSLGIGLEGLKKINLSPRKFENNFRERFSDLEFKKLSVWGYNHPEGQTFWESPYEKAHISFGVKLETERQILDVDSERKTAWQILDTAREKFESKHKKRILEWIRTFTLFSVKRFTFNFYDGDYAVYDIPLKKRNI